LKFKQTQFVGFDPDKISSLKRILHFFRPSELTVSSRFACHILFV